ncbi:MAG: D-alanyl-D-alanine carboxypeptidase, partial [Phycisphaerae bacterium]|nr:D-alanyl-D-alanine carboxypeptidase [Phycisphaerae bacterium]
TALLDVLPDVTERSLYLAAAWLFKTLGTTVKLPDSTASGRQGSWLTGRHAIEGFLTKLRISDKYYIDDGSGLSRKNLISSRGLTTLLAHMHSHKHANIFKDAMATPQNGTLAKRKRFNDQKYQARIYAKTGHLTGVNALAGYVKTKGNRWLAFAIITNQWSATNSMIDNVVKAVID